MTTFIRRMPVAEAASGDPGSLRAPLRLAVKDNIDLAGWPTTNGSRVIAETASPATGDAACLAGCRRAEAAGSLTLVGQTNMHELAFGVTGINPWYGTPTNPIRAGCVPGGSSSGSAVAVATGEADVAFGTDTGGSVRIPAACCGVAALKTTWGRIPLEGVLPLAPSLDTIGPMAASVAGVAAGMALLEPDFTPARRPAARIGRLRLPATRAVDSAVDAALSAYARASGAVTAPIDLPGWTAATSAAMTVLAAEAWEVHGGLWREHGDRLSPDVAARLEGASRLDPAEVDRARQGAQIWRAELERAFAGIDLLALPVLAEEPPTVADAQRLTGIRYVAPLNLSGNPALAMPLRLGEDRTGVFPASLQLVGPCGSEELVLATGLAIESLSGDQPDGRPPD